MEFGGTQYYVGPTIRDREVGGSNPLAPTNYIKHFRLPARVAVLVLWESFLALHLATLTSYKVAEALVELDNRLRMWQ